MLSTCSNVGRDNSVGIANYYGLDGPGDRIPVGTRFSAPVRTSPVAYPAFCTIDTRPFPGLKRPENGVNYPLPSSAEVKESVEP